MADNKSGEAQQHALYGPEFKADPFPPTPKCGGRSPSPCLITKQRRFEIG